MALTLGLLFAAPAAEGKERTLSDHNKYVKSLFEGKKQAWRVEYRTKHPFGAKLQRKARERRKALPNRAARAAAHRYWQLKTKNQRKHVREWERLTPYGPVGGEYFAIPVFIVACETGRRFNWTAANPSGAIGVYQLLGKGAPWPASSDADKARHHRIAANLWAGGSGASHWTQCL